jgi:hypothetical protein
MSPSSEHLMSSFSNSSSSSYLLLISYIEEGVKELLFKKEDINSHRKGELIKITLLLRVESNIYKSFQNIIRRRGFLELYILWKRMYGLRY